MKKMLKCGFCIIIPALKWCLNYTNYLYSFHPHRNLIKIQQSNNIESLKLLHYTNNTMPKLLKIDKTKL